ncbi:MAG TPA: sugar phosphate isomerase/epimerase [Streptosporangiaceae bacterium]|nr:sugar phosphate isomerase/epimerase [Streptosporangiaceae bacterium]
MTSSQADGAAAGPAPSAGGPAAGVARPKIQIALSTASVFPERVPDAFETAARLGYDALEVMVTADPVSQDAGVLARLSDYHSIPVVAVHAPTLLVTQRVWGRDPWGKLQRSREMAEQLGAGVVVVHPPFRWQREYAREFEGGLGELSRDSGIAFAAENLYPLSRGETEVAAYAPHWNPAEMNVPFATLDVSHAAVSGSDVLEMARQLGPRMTHVHLGDGTRPGLPDEHLVPGRGTQPCAELLGMLRTDDYRGIVVLEVNTHRAADAAQRNADLAESLAFARRHLEGSPLDREASLSR